MNTPNLSEMGFRLVSCCFRRWPSVMSWGKVFSFLKKKNSLGEKQNQHIFQKTSKIFKNHLSKALFHLFLIFVEGKKNWVGSVFHMLFKSTWNFAPSEGRIYVLCVYQFINSFGYFVAWPTCTKNWESNSKNLAKYQSLSAPYIVSCGGGFIGAIQYRL